MVMTTIMMKTVSCVLTLVSWLVLVLVLGLVLVFVFVALNDNVHA